MDNPDLVLEAINTAARAHQGQMRKDGQTPYISHPLRVMTVVATLFDVRDADILAAAALHDVLEDTTLDRDDLIEQFGERVAKWVALLSKDKRLPEKRREDKYFARLKTAPAAVQLIKLGDSFDNLTGALSLSLRERKKAVKKARRLLSNLERFPARWRRAVDAVKERISAAENS